MTDGRYHFYMPEQTARFHFFLPVVVLCASLFLLSWLGLRPAQGVYAQAAPPRVIAWMPAGDADVALASFRQHQSQIDEISPFWYSLAADGSLRPRAGAPDPTLITEAHQAGILVIPTISNGFDPDRIHTILNHDATRAQHIQALVHEVLVSNYDGIDIDYENLYAADKDVYSQFLAELAVALHDYNRLLSVAVQAKTNTFAGWDGVGALDYQTIGAVADEVRLMTYGWCWRSGCVGGEPPGPIAPLHWVQDVAAYAQRLIPSPKLILGIPLYGYDWWPAANAARGTEDAKAWLEPVFAAAPDGDVQGMALNWWDVQTLVQQYDPQIQWWEKDDAGLIQEHWFSYGEDHSVVYADQDSVRVRWKLAQQSGLGGVSLWYLGSDDPHIWDFLGKSPSLIPTPTPTPTPSRLFLPLLRQ